MLFSCTKSEQRIQRTLYSCREQKLFSCFRWWICRSLLLFFKSSLVPDWCKRIVTDFEMCFKISAHEKSDWIALPASNFFNTSSSNSTCTVIRDWYAKLLYHNIALSYVTDTQYIFVITFLHCHTWLICTTALWSRSCAVIHDRYATLFCDDSFFYIDSIDLSSVTLKLEALHYLHSFDVGPEFRESTYRTLRDVLWDVFRFVVIQPFIILSFSSSHRGIFDARGLQQACHV